MLTILTLVICNIRGLKSHNLAGRHYPRTRLVTSSDSLAMNDGRAAAALVSGRVTAEMKAVLMPAVAAVRPAEKGHTPIGRSVGRTGRLFWHTILLASDRQRGGRAGSIIAWAARLHNAHFMTTAGARQEERKTHVNLVL